VEVRSAVLGAIMGTIERGEDEDEDEERVCDSRVSGDFRGLI
jgi:hypothetical protein